MISILFSGCSAISSAKKMILTITSRWSFPGHEPLKTVANTVAGIHLLMLCWFWQVSSRSKASGGPFVFPPVIPLPQWQLVESKPLKAETVELLAFGKILPGREYIQKELPLDIKMRYEVEADGNFSKFIKITLISSFRSINQLPDVRQHERLGFYGLCIRNRRT